MSVSVVPKPRIPDCSPGSHVFNTPLKIFTVPFITNCQCLQLTYRCFHHMSAMTSHETCLASMYVSHGSQSAEVRSVHNAQCHDPFAQQNLGFAH